MPGWADIQSRGRSWLFGGVLIAVGVAVGYALPQSSASPQSEVGTVARFAGKQSTARPGEEFTFTPKNGTKQNYWFVSSVPWQASKTSKWISRGTPPCLKFAPAPAARSTSKSKSSKSAGPSPSPSTTSAPDLVTLGVVNIHGVGSAPGSPMVVWVECYT